MLRQRFGRKDEEVGLITDLESEELSASVWLAANRADWGIEYGSHQRLDVTLNDDLCRVRSGNGLLVILETPVVGDVFWGVVFVAINWKPMLSNSKIQLRSSWDLPHFPGETFLHRTHAGSPLR